MPVVAGDAPVGIINRKQIVERFTKLYARELLGRKPISSVMDHDPLIVDIQTDLDELSQAIMKRGMYYMHEGFIVTDNGCYRRHGHGLRPDEDDHRPHPSRLYRLAHYDPVTGLPNRLLFMDRLQSDRPGATQRAPRGRDVARPGPLQGHQRFVRPQHG